MEFLKKNWIWITIAVIVLIVILYFVTRKPAPTPVIIQNPQASTNQPTSNIAQIITALGGLSAAVGGWSIWNNNDEDDENSSSNIGGQ